ncbi:hypothetical protein GCM10007938_35830 [Vibrio zhanjiangensis]|uniref:Uncharacterized protein n=1 Tax=Vibrio zhanjiangensis TaxID=1046128 RepID=A0ABQ6F4M0_9VIBR|nr:hypothetical protein [Vibrio zhanjiangensis]GLT19800.1 hypothetical protein GCM10007938_35830 [Vibrio zhanjiangensis]
MLKPASQRPTDIGLYPVVPSDSSIDSYDTRTVKAVEKRNDKDPSVVSHSRGPDFSEEGITGELNFEDLGSWYRAQAELSEKIIDECELQKLGRFLQLEEDEASQNLLKEAERLWLLSRGLRLMMSSLVGA